MTALGRANRETAQARNFYIIVGLAQQAKYEVAPLSADRLDSWKDIAAYLKKSVRTVRRWEEQHGLPVYRVGDQAGSSVFAYKSELDAWWQSYNERDGCTATKDNPLRQTIQEVQLGTGICPANSRIFSAQKPLIIGSLAALTALAAAYYAFERSRQHEVTRPQATPLTTLPGREVQSSLSPDGNHVAFAYDGDPTSKFNIYVKSIGSEQITRLTSSAADDLSPSWSPDGLNIAFLRYLSDQSAAVMVVPAAGGVERQLAKVAVERVEQEIRVNWSPDGHWLATSDKETPLSRLKVTLISTSTGVKRRLRYRPEPADADLNPVISPDGRYVAFAHHTSVAVADIYLLRLPTESDPEPTARPLTLWKRLNKSPVWRSNNDLLFVGDEGHIGSRIWQLPVFGGGSPRRLEGIGEDSTSVTCTQQKDRLVYSRETRDLNIWKLDLHETARRPGKQPVLARLLASTRNDNQPQYSPDGKLIAFQSDRSGQHDIWLANSDGSEPRRITRMPAEVSGHARWSPNGKSLVFHSRLNGDANLYVVDVETGGYRPLTTGSTNDSAASWSPDNKWIFFESERSGIPQIWKTPASGGPASKVTRNGGALALASPDGKTLLYSKFNAPGLWMLPLAGGEEVQLAPAISTIDSFAVTKTGVYFARPTSTREVAIVFLSFEDRSTQELARLKVPACYGLSVSPDQRSILYAQADYLASDLVLVDHFN